MQHLDLSSGGGLRAPAATAFWPPRAGRTPTRLALPARIGVVDEDETMRQSIRSLLADVGFGVDAYDSLTAFRAGLYRSLPDVVIAGQCSPGQDGATVLGTLRAFSQMPVIVLRDLGPEADRVAATEREADDYLPRPCDVRELLLRLRTQLRRAKNPTDPSSVVAGSRTRSAWFGRWQLDRQRRRLVDAHGVECAITGADYALLAVFADHPRMVLSRERLMNLAGIDPAEVFDRAVDMRITRLRKKIEATPRDPAVIRTVRGHGGGYEFIPAD